MKARLFLLLALMTPASALAVMPATDQFIPALAHRAGFPPGAVAR